MRPTVYGDGRDVARRIKTTRPQRSGELLAYFAFDGFKLGCEKFDSAHAVLIACGQPRLARRFHHVHHDRLIGASREVVITNTDGKVEPKIGVITGGRINRHCSELLKCSPVVQGDIGV